MISPSDEERMGRAMAIYNAALHTVQSGVKLMDLDGGPDKSPAGPKHLRTGLNSAMVNDQAIAELLIEKGIITRVEYYEKLADCMMKEADTYQRRAKERFGAHVNLG